MKVKIRNNASYDEFRAVCEAFGLDADDVLAGGSIEGAKWPGEAKAQKALRKMCRTRHRIEEKHFPAILGSFVRMNVFPVERVTRDLERISRSCRRVRRFAWFWKLVEKVVRRGT